ncbi:MAG: helix-turn-helix domain-containing protein, partial [Candidatus Limnocylindrales bacterium]
MTAQLPPRPTDATLSVTKAARLLGVHPNTVRSWSDAGRLRFYRINPRGDRRYRLGDLQRFLSAAERLPTHPPPGAPVGMRRRFDPSVVALAMRGDMAAAAIAPEADPVLAEGHQRDLALLDTIASGAVTSRDLDDELARIVRAVRDSADRALVSIWEVAGERLVPRAAAIPPGTAMPRLLDLPLTFGVMGRALRLGGTARDPTDPPGA